MRPLRTAFSLQRQRQLLVRPAAAGHAAKIRNGLFVRDLFAQSDRGQGV
jgi:hypothetical protein